MSTSTMLRFNPSPPPLQSATKSPLPETTRPDFIPIEGPILSENSFCKCGRRHLIPSMAAAAAALLPVPSAVASRFDSPSSSSTEALGKIHPSRPDWYEEFYAAAMNNSMKVYEAEIASYKSKLFSAVRGKASEILEIGIGTGPNLKYYAGNGGVRVFGVDPNRKMEKYARAAVEDAGLPQENFEFLQAVGEDLPLANSSMDAVIGTLVLCSVTDVKRTLGEVKRVLKPGGIYVFVEHVGAKDGTLLRFLQNILDPVQQFVADGCHLTRDTAKLIAEAEFSQVDGRMIFVSEASLINPHVLDVTCRQAPQSCGIMQ
ncbi:Thiol S-methyltransferase TMT1B-like protein [Drosera capensis]